MQSPNKKRQTAAERAHVGIIKAMPCACCGVPGPSEAHEIEQGLWFTCLPLCASCHRGELAGLHGQKRAWIIRKKTELSCLNETIGALV